MKLKVIVIALSTVAVVAATPLQAGWKGGNRQAPAPVESTAVLSDAETDNLIFMREEEKLARDVYITLFDQWAHPVFDNIAESEQRHMDALKSKLDKYGLADPAQDDTTGVFVNSELASLYEELVEKGMVSLKEAFYTGALIEEIDIRDIELAIEESSHQDIIRTYENLMRGSRNHLRAFVRQIENLGIVYEAQMLDQEAVDRILGSGMERGGKMGRKGPGGR